MMKRNTFIKTAALGSIAVCLGCVAGCKKEEPGTNPAPLPPGGLQIDLSKSENSSLNTVGGSLVKEGVILAQPEADVFIALSVGCTHQGISIAYVHSGKKFRCPAHGSEFDRNGKVLIGPATTALQKYTVSRNGNVLSVN